MEDMIPMGRIENKILQVRGQKVLLDRDLAELYGVETRTLKQSVRRNIERFPEEFMFELNNDELRNLRSQIVMSSSGNWGGVRYNPMAFTEHGVAMLSSVLKSKKAIAINIMIIKAFVRMRQLINSSAEVANKISELEKRLDSHDEIIVNIIQKLKHLLDPEVKNKPQIGFKND